MVATHGLEMSARGAHKRLLQASSSAVFPAISAAAMLRQPPLQASHALPAVHLPVRFILAGGVTVPCSLAPPTQHSSSVRTTAGCVPLKPQQPRLLPCCSLQRAIIAAFGACRPACCRGGCSQVRPPPGLQGRVLLAPLPIIAVARPPGERMLQVPGVAMLPPSVPGRPHAGNFMDGAAWSTLNAAAAPLRQALWSPAMLPLLPSIWWLLCTAAARSWVLAAETMRTAWEGGNGGVGCCNPAERL
jgi:hypothetical protein